MFTRRPSASRAFTLVEMLVVIGIIAVLVGLLLPAINMAVNAARRAAISLEISQLANGIETYKQQKGEYPPSFGEDYGTPYTTVVERHLQRCYPKMTAAKKMDFYSKIDSDKVDQAEALVLWLRLVGTNPADPFEMTATRSGYYEFDERRLNDDDGDSVPAYIAKYCRDTPYIYIENRTYGKHLSSANAASGLSDSYYAQPYFADGTGNTATTLKGINPTKFQIIAAGLDGDFGKIYNNTGSTYSDLKLYPSGTKLEEGDLDNLTNFSEGRTLGDSRPQ
ncbi:hypothetical protein ETAA8_64030 [Anatilimnocola aggregata]|uniref:Prepilin-type N-terminal cleavage/methylation domain-containing protein n=1 Tax=Anatilimnocola aggregata TaxID=2528021 RepID=A0A517YM05_9BACT|nr:type II secretion system protein [Anatilimnocola aggregata]QDU31250.1 hypothetical protein ETAA8_64030 [Anatilimnocola aggregata]